jgi:hypothetical protein
VQAAEQAGQEVVTPLQVTDPRAPGQELFTTEQDPAADEQVTVLPSQQFAVVMQPGFGGITQWEWDGT